MNVAITAIANGLYANLSKTEFRFVNVVLSELSKTMFSMEILHSICCKETKEEKKEVKKRRKIYRLRRIGKI